MERPTYLPAALVVKNLSHPLGKNWRRYAGAAGKFFDGVGDVSDARGNNFSWDRGIGGREGSGELDIILVPCREFVLRVPYPCRAFEHFAQLGFVLRALRPVKLGLTHLEALLG
jgi:hypothetical protein